MSNKKLSGKALVIQITREQTRVGLVRLGQTNPELQASVVLPTPDGAVEDGEIRNLTDMKDLLRPVLEDPVFRRVHRCVFVLCSSRVISSSAKLPAKQKGKRLDQVLRANMDEYFPIQTEDYLLTWEQVGQTVTDGFKENLIQMWAVPRLVVSRYYELGAGLGLTVAAVDYCGNSAACAAGVSFVASKKLAAAHKPGAKKGLSFGGKKNKKAQQAVEPVAVLEEPVYEEGESTLYLHVDDDSIITTFVTDGQVKLQRLVQRGFSLDADLGETSISMEYFNALPETTARVSSVILSGSAVGEVLACGVEDILGLPVDILPCMPDPSWALVLGASRTKLDFGIPELSRDGSEAKLWQFPLVLAGAGALMAVIMLTMTSSLTWTTELGSLRNTQNQMMILAQQNSGAADDYHKYESAYNAYSSDWNALQGSIRTYNDNLVLLLEEFESKVPTSATVTTLQITDQSMSAQLAFQELEDLAYFIQTVRDMEYATLQGFSSVSMGPYYTAEMLRAMQGQTNDAAGDLMAALGMAGLGGGAVDEQTLSAIMSLINAQADTNSASVDMNSINQILNLYSNMTGGNTAAPTEGSFETNVFAVSELPPTEGSSLMDLLGGFGFDKKDLDMNKLMDALVAINGGPLGVDEILLYNDLMNAVKTGDVEKIDPAALADVLNAVEKANGGSGNRFTKSQMEVLLSLVTGFGSGSSGSGNGGSGNSGGSGSSGSGNSNSGNSSSGSNNTILGDYSSGDFAKILKDNDITVDQLRLNLQSLTLDELEALQEGYGPDFGYEAEDLEDMLDASKRKGTAQKAALRSLLSYSPRKKDDDPAAMFRFFLLLREDAKKENKDQILYRMLEDELEDDKGLYNMIFGTSTDKSLKNNMSEFIDLLNRKKDHRLAAIELIQTDELLSAKLAAHLAYELDKEKSVDTSLDMDQILADLQSGKVLEKPENVKNAALALLGEKAEKLYRAEVERLLFADNFDINDFLPDPVQPIEPEIRYFIQVAFSYDESLILAEQQRKGLDFSVKVPGPLSVDAAQEVSQ